MRTCPHAELELAVSHIRTASLNHARVIVEGVVPIYDFGLVHDDTKRMPVAGDVTVCGVKVGCVIDGRCILTKSGVWVHPVSKRANRV